VSFRWNDGCVENRSRTRQSKRHLALTQFVAPHRRKRRVDGSAAYGQMQRVGAFYGFQPGYGIVVYAERGRTTFFTTRFQPALVVQDWVNYEDTRRAYGPCAHQEIGKKLRVSA
jgi:hypothetical protein